MCLDKLWIKSDLMMDAGITIVKAFRDLGPALGSLMREYDFVFDEWQVSSIGNIYVYPEFIDAIFHHHQYLSGFHGFHNRQDAIYWLKCNRWLDPTIVLCRATLRKITAIGAQNCCSSLDAVPVVVGREIQITSEDWKKREFIYDLTEITNRDKKV